MIDEFLVHVMSDVVPNGAGGMVILIAILLLALYVLGKGADVLVDEAVVLSTRWGVPKMLIGATIVSLGTTLPEVTVSVMSALNGAPDLAMGNAVGSVICDTGLILGIAALIRPLPFRKSVVNKQGWVQLGSGVLLILTAFIGGGGFKVFTEGGHIPRFMGFVYLILLACYLYFTICSAKGSSGDEGGNGEGETEKSSTGIVILKMAIGALLVIASSKVLIPTVQEVALRCFIPETVIAATLVAFGTSLPELITGITAARKGHGDLAIGNIIGADILNVLFVIGAATAVTKGGLFVDASFFTMLFPVMLFVLLVFKGSILVSKDHLKRPVGAVLLLAYILVTVLSFVIA